MLAPRATRSTIPYGDAGIESTLRTMERLARGGAKHPDVIAWAQAHVRGVPARDHDGEARALLAGVRRALRYTHDPLEAEYVKAPDVSVREAATHGVFVGDCDDAIVLLMATLGAVGIPSQPVVVSQDGGVYTHVLVRYLSPRGGWVTLDPIVNQPAGWFPPDAKRAGVFMGGGIRPMPAAAVQGWSAGSGARVRTPVVHGYTRPGAYVPRAAPQAAVGALAGYVTPLEAPVTAGPLARLSAALSPYETLLWFAWAGASAWAVLRARRR